jgi:hypothetical protein
LGPPSSSFRPVGSGCRPRGLSAAASAAICEQIRDSLPCSSAPLQSLTAAASRRRPVQVSLSLGACAGQVPTTSRCVLRRSAHRSASEEASGWLPLAGSGASSEPVNGLTEPPVAGVERGARRPRSTGSPVGPKAGRLRTSSQRTSSFAHRGARATRVSLAWRHRSGDGRATSRPRSRAAFAKPSRHGFGPWPPPKRRLGLRDRGPEVASRARRRWASPATRGAEDAQRVFRRHLPWGSFPFRRHRHGRSLRRFASPTPSVLRVSHPLDGLIPPGPCGFVSPHYRP